MVARKWCFVPGCVSTTIKTPTKVFVSVPKEITKRKKWVATVGRDIKDVSSASTIYCCEDHFNVSLCRLVLRHKIVYCFARSKNDTFCGEAVVLALTPLDSTWL